MTRCRIDISYDGTAYSGWQRQPNGFSVQQAIEEALVRVIGVETRIHGSGRTDQGVHAKGQVAHFDMAKDLGLASLRDGLNALVPSDIRIMKARGVPDAFHARKSATSKEYRYFIWNADVVPPFVCRYRTHVKKGLNIDAMRAAAKLLLGRHDFAAFAANPNRDIQSTVRSLFDLRVTKRGPEIVIAARGDGFLYKMVRSMAGWLMRVGEGHSPSETLKILESGTRTARVPTAPALGLFLWSVRY